MRKEGQKTPSSKFTVEEVSKIREIARQIVNSTQEVDDAGIFRSEMKMWEPGNRLETPIDLGRKERRVRAEADALDDQLATLRSVIKILRVREEELQRKVDALQEKCPHEKFRYDGFAESASFGKCLVCKKSVIYQRASPT